MVRSLGLVGLIVVAMVTFSQLRQPEHPPVTVDVAATVQAARAEAGFPVLAATALPEQWYANSATFAAIEGEPGHSAFHLGYTDGSGGYVGIDVSNADDPKTLTDVFESVPPLGSRVIAGLAFASYPAGEGSGWLHRAIGGEPFTIRIEATGGRAAAAVVEALAAEGATPVGLTAG